MKEIKSNLWIEQVMQQASIVKDFIHSDMLFVKDSFCV